MNDFLSTTFHVSSKDRIPFQCTGCGECCRHVRQSVPVESLDLFRLTKLLKAAGEEHIDCTDDFLDKYTDMALIDECGYFMFMLKVAEPDDACIFLKDNRCTVHAANPRACRIYPFVATPADHGGFEYLVSKEKTHHFTGTPVHVKGWMKERFTSEDREFINTDLGSAVAIAKLLRSIPDENKAQALMLFWRFKYSDFDLDEPFLPQYRRNMQRLTIALRALAVRP